jgi:hypothetical protein
VLLEFIKGVRNILCLIKKQKKKLFISNSLTEIKNELKRKKKSIDQHLVKEFDLSQEEFLLIDYIKEYTKMLNKNNVTRTQAYLYFYLRHPEIHWALLGHLVSRNGGWNMTDLKGELISNLLSEKDQQAFFSFLERGNWLIFQDVYPQFLIYEESLKRNINLFYLLPYFNVSTFMETVWNYFLKTGDHYILAIALVINEQSYLEKRVIKNPVFKEGVLDTIEFKLQDFLSLNHILFPYYENIKEKQQVVLIGQTLHHFSSLHERILLGKRLYSLLFHDKERLSKIVRWAISQPHTGSRKDYWPYLYNDVRDSIPGLLYKRRIKNCQLRKGASPIYSPKLIYVWKDIAHEKAEIGDWFDDWKIIQYLNDQNDEVNGEIKHEYCETLEKIELAILAKKAILR